MRGYIFILTFFITAAGFGQTQNQKLTITPLTGNFYVYTTFGDPGDGNMFPSNGMYLVTGKGVVLFDTPWDTTQFQPLLDSIKARHRQNAVMCISTHFHDDKTAGLNYYKQKGIKTYTTKRTDDLSKQRNKPRAAYLIYQDTVFQIGQYRFEVFYPGKGHSPDNIVIWFAKEKILYGGCFIKSTDTNSPGNLSDASIEDWIKSIKNVQSKCKNPSFVITGHQGFSDTSAVLHTLKLLEEYKEKNNQ